jgi:ABC-type multidrug transport system fused ATPase/permease subunit
VATLERVGLWRVISGRANPSGAQSIDPLDATMDQEFLSHGQRQLFCLARSLLNKTSLLILDEPTSSVDSETDAQMQAIIRSEFQHCTVIMIAHRLDSLLDFDRVAVLDKGSLVEFDDPRALLAKEDSAFAKLYRGMAISTRSS